jgi:DNA-directed RNA polymerase II subunit RPB4
MTSHAPRARTREAPAGDEEATSELKLGEFQETQTLTLSEARLLVNTVLEVRKQQGSETNETEYVHQSLEILSA